MDLPPALEPPLCHILVGAAAVCAVNAFVVVERLNATMVFQWCCHG